MNEKKEYIERGALIAAMHKETEQYHLRVVMEFPAADVEPVVRTVGDLIKSIIRCNSIIALYEEHSEEDGRPLYEIWRGMEWEIPTEYSKRKFVRIFGSIPESIIKADTINIQVERSGSGV